MNTNYVIKTRNLFRRIWSYAALLGLCLCGPVAAVAGSSYAGFYSGTYTTTSGTNDHGVFAAFVDAGGTAALVIQSQAGIVSDGGFDENIPLSSSGTIINYTNSDGTVINASISGGILTGTWVGSRNSGNIAAGARSATGSYQGSAGYYAGTVINSDSSTTSAIRLILTPDGSFYGGLQNNINSDSDGFSGTMIGDTILFISSGGTAVNGTLDTTSYLLNAIYTGPDGIGTFTLNRTDKLTGSATPWPDATDLGNGWMNSSWFGTFNVNSYPWIYHQQNGWMYVFGTDPTSIWLWTPDLGFLWTGQSVYPWLWSNTQQTWLYYSVGSSNPRYFYNWNSQKWVAVNP